MQNQQKVKAFELRRQEQPALDGVLIRLRSELVGLRTSKVASAPSVKLARIRVSNSFNCSWLPSAELNDFWWSRTLVDHNLTSFSWKYTHIPNRSNEIAGAFSLCSSSIFMDMNVLEIWFWSFSEITISQKLFSWLIWWYVSFMGIRIIIISAQNS